MGDPLTAEYENLERENQFRASKDSGGGAGNGSGNGAGSKTRLGDVEHNGLLGQDAVRLGSKDGRAAEPAAIMANDLLTQPESPSHSAATRAAGHELDSFLGKAFEEKPIWTGLYESIRDVFFPLKLPPLELTSTPIPVPDRMAVKTNPWAVGTATTVNGLILLLVLYFGARAVINKIIPPKLDATNVEISEFQAPKHVQLAGGGGGGGSHEIIDQIKGKLPKIDKAPVTPPQVPLLDKPKLAVQSAIAVQQDIKLPDNPNMPMIGVTNSANVTLASNGQGTGGGMGTGSGGGLGPGSGNGFGPGSGGNTGGGVFRVGGGISAPVPVVWPEAEFSDEARRAKYQGVCLVSLIVDAQGNPQNPRVVRPLGMGLDEKALEAVRKYKFKPALKDGRTPVPVMITIEVNFRLY
jgi:protein TonB